MSYSAVNHPYTDPTYNESQAGFVTPGNASKKRGVSPWLKFGIPVLILVIAGAVVGGIFGSKAAKKSADSSGGNVSPEAAASAKLEVGRFATATASQFMMPIYPSAVSCRPFIHLVYVVSIDNPRPTPLPSAHLLSPIMLILHGLKTLSSLQVLPPLNPAMIVPD